MTWTRRRFVKLGIGVAAGSALAYWRGCYYPRAGSFEDVRFLTPRTAAILAAIVEAVLPPSAERGRDTVDAHVRAIDQQLATFAPGTAHEMNELLTLLEQATLPLGGDVARLSSLSVADRATYLNGLRTSSHDILRAGLRGLVSLIFLAYYRDAAAFTPIGYPGPILPGGGVAGDYARLVAPAGALP